MLSFQPNNCHFSQTETQGGVRNFANEIFYRILAAFYIIHMEKHPFNFSVYFPFFIFFIFVLSLVSCGWEESLSSAGRGDSIRFKAGHSFKNGIATRTVYSGQYYGETLVRERIDWVQGDEIRIWSDKATTRNGSEHWADYLVTPTSSNQANSYASISNKNGNGLVWGEGTHAFYSIYPSPVSGALTTSGTGEVVTASIPELQTYTVNGDNLEPDMDYAYMFAALKTNASSSVTLSFQPMFTAFEFTIDSADDQNLTLTSFVMESASSPMSGDFTATLDAKEDGTTSTAAYDWGETKKSIRLAFSGGGLTIRKGEPKTFTIFTLPAEQTDLTIRFTASNGQVNSLKLNDSEGIPLSFQGGRKHRITSLGIPGAWSYSMEQIGNITLTANAEKVYGAERTVTVTSRQTRGSTQRPFPWRAQAQVNGQWVEADDPLWPAWIALSASQGAGDDDEVVVTIGPNEVYKGPPSGLGADIAGPMSLLPEKGTENAPYDLSAYDIYGNRNAGGRATTANCYVVSAPGWYMLPLVYGNAIKNGAANTAAYRPGIQRPLVMASLVGAEGNPVSSPYILQDAGLSASSNHDACIVWEDVSPGYGMLDSESVEIVTAPSGAALSCPYIRFRVPAGSIRPGNAVIALRDKDHGNRILWSWHIWLYPPDQDDLRTSSVVFRPTASTTARIDLMNVNLGWSPPVSYPAATTDRRSVRLRFVQETPGTASRTMTVTQNAFQGAAYIGESYSSTFYQWGRKDPFLPARGFLPAAGNKSASSPAGYTITSGTSAVVMSNSNISQIEGLIPLFIQEPYRLIRNDDEKGGLNAWDADNTAYEADSPVIKTIYDPCPPGFSVPRLHAFTGFTRSGENATGPSEILGDFVDTDSNGSRPCGWLFTTSGTHGDKTLFFPLAGMRNYLGNMVSNSERGYYWTSGRYRKTSPEQFYSISGFLTQGRVDPGYNVPAGHAMAIRPMKEP